MDNTNKEEQLKGIQGCIKIVTDKLNKPNDCDHLLPQDPETGVSECNLEVRGDLCQCALRIEILEDVQKDLIQLLKDNEV